MTPILRLLLLVILLSVHTRGQEGSGDFPLELSPMMSPTATCSLAATSVLGPGSGSGSGSEAYLQPDSSILASMYLCSELYSLSSKEFAVVTSSVDFGSGSGGSNTLIHTSLLFSTELADIFPSSPFVQSLTPSPVMQSVIAKPSDSESLITNSLTNQFSSFFAFTSPSLVSSDVVLPENISVGLKTSLLESSTLFLSSVVTASSVSIVVSDTFSSISVEAISSFTLFPTILSVPVSQTLPVSISLSPSVLSSSALNMSKDISPFSTLSSAVLTTSFSLPLSISATATLSSTPTFSDFPTFSLPLFQLSSALTSSFISSGSGTTTQSVSNIDIGSFLTNSVMASSSPEISMQSTSLSLPFLSLSFSSPQSFSSSLPSTTSITFQSASMNALGSSTFLLPPPASSMELLSQPVPATSTDGAAVSSLLIPAPTATLTHSLFDVSTPSPVLIVLTSTLASPQESSFSPTMVTTTITSTLDFTISDPLSIVVSSLPDSSTLSFSLLATVISSSSAIVPLPSPTSGSLTELQLVLTSLQHTRLQNSTSTERADLEAALLFEYQRALSQLGARNKREEGTTIAKVTEVGIRGADGETPIIFYIVAGGQPIQASLVTNILESLSLQEIAGYPVVGVRIFSEITTSNQITVLSTADVSMVVVSAIPLAGIVGGVVAVALVLVIMGVLLTGCLVITVHRKQNKNLVQNIDSHNVESVSTDRESVAIQHGTPAIEKLTRRARQKRQQALSSLALLASSSSNQLDAWQNHQLERRMEEPPAALFEHVVHYSDVHPSPAVTRPFRAKFHSSSVAPSPSISHKSKGSTSVERIQKVSGSEPDQHSQVSQSQGLAHPAHLARQDTDENEITQQKQMALERLKLQSQQLRGSSRRKRRQQQPQQMDNPLLPPPVPPQQQQQSKGGESEGEAALGDAEASSHSDGPPAVPLAPSRPTTRRRIARRKLTSRGHSVASAADTDGYDMTDHHYVPPSRQSRKHRLGRNLRARPLTQQLRMGSGRASRATTFDARQELAWMSTGDGVQLISIQPVEPVHVPPPNLHPPALRPAWQPLPHLPTNRQSQSYSRQQLEQLLQIHRELEHVEQGLLHRRVSGTPDSSSINLHRPGDSPHELPMESSYSPEELAGHVFAPSGHFSQPILLNSPPTAAAWHPMTGMSQNTQPYSINTASQLVWTPQGHHHPQVIQSQPMAPVQLTQMRTAHPGYHYGQHHPTHVW